ncbi:class I SAM-dependent rRNA methyltransferase [Acidicapsa acidisoli]|uniref:class I SAM-dependent rRNA methyltransferase n=1 Tax=Acidicapsa acidisoli TaxID=1615681 RepID=UPI0021DFD59B|nr:class I SAM-dependent rRNA methyltransferase [Acidicapsa acidisoli]
MAKPRNPQSPPLTKAPTATKPTSPFTRPDIRKTSSKPDRTPNRSEARKPQSQRNEADAARQGRPTPAKPTPRPANISSPVQEFGARITRRASDRLRNGHLWVYATDIESIFTGNEDAPALLPVADNRGLLLGTALYSPASQIALRLVSREAIDQAKWLSLLATRLRAAIARRLPLLNADTDACRLVFSEADNLPGLIIDKYAGIVIVQLLAKGLDRADVREICVQALRQELVTIKDTLTIWERPDPRIRELEGLSAPASTPLFASNPESPAASTLFRLNGLSFHFDVNSGQKTGAFLDQRQNYAAAAAWAKARGTKKALDICTYQGGFALHLAQVCEQVTGVDASRASLEVAERNLEANRSHLKTEVDWLEADAFELLRGWSEAKEPSDFDLIVLDPPAFAKSKRAVEGALRGYKELNLRALHLLKPGGLLITCSCSHHITWTDLESAVASAAIDAHRRVTLLERRGAAQDHPVLLNLPETEYLKCLICAVD